MQNRFFYACLADITQLKRNTQHVRIILYLPQESVSEASSRLKLQTSIWRHSRRILAKSPRSPCGVWNPSKNQAWYWWRCEVRHNASGRIEEISSRRYTRKIGYKQFSTMDSIGESLCRGWTPLETSAESAMGVDESSMNTKQGAGGPRLMFAFCDQLKAERVNACNRI